MTELRGIAASPGIAIGSVFLYSDTALDVPQYPIEYGEVDREKDRLSNAVSRACDDIEELRNASSGPLAQDEQRMLDSHLLMLRDPTFLDSIHTRLEDELHNIEWILYRTVIDLVDKLSTAGDEYLRERTGDIHDVSRRVLRHLLEHERTDLAALDREIILVAHDLMPSDAIAMNKRMVRGIAMDAGGKTSHTAILARSFEIPAVLALSTISREVRNGTVVIIDGNRGLVIVDPDQSTLSRYETLRHQWQEHEVQLMGLNDLEAETTDGRLVRLKGNIEVPEEVEAVLSHGADGIGLYRSEFLFIRPGVLPTEEEQYEAYSGVLQAMGGRPVTIRTLDVGGDKIAPGLMAAGEKNPILGWRAIRLCLSHTDVFRSQLRALLRASVHGALRVMFPMISGTIELERALEIFEEVREELDRRGIARARDIPVGVMIEVPSAALISDLLARRVDFFSIGTNDLIQYTIAVDRGNERVAYLYEPFHPGVLRLIQLVIRNAHGEGIPVAMCGEMAGDPLAAPVLLGLGLDEFSMSSVGIPEVKRLIRSISYAEAEELAGHVMDMRDSREIHNAVREHIRERFDLLVY